MQKLRPWSVKGVSEEAREAARTASAAVEMPIGAWIDLTIKDITTDKTPAPTFDLPPDTAGRSTTVAAAIQALEEQITHSHDHATDNVGVIREIIEDLSLRIDTLERHRRLLPRTTLFVEKEDRPTGSAQAEEQNQPESHDKRPTRRERRSAARVRVAEKRAARAQARAARKPTARKVNSEAAAPKPRSARRVVKKVLVGTALMSSGLIAAIVAIWFAVFQTPGNPLRLSANLTAAEPAQDAVSELPQILSLVLPTNTPRSSIAQLRTKAESGDAAAQARLAMLYAEGRTVNQDYAAATDWLTQAAAAGHAEAQYNLGVIYSRGLGVEPNPVQATIWFHSAAEQNYTKAQYALGLAYALAEGVDQNYREATDWLQRAAEQGYAEAQFALATLLEDGVSGRPDFDGAYYWYQAAVANGSEKAAKRAALLLPRLNAATDSGALPAPPPPSDVTQNTVAEIQELLAALDFFAAPPNGIIDDPTRAAIRDYQAQLGLRVDGKASAELLRHLKTVTGPQ